MSMTGWTALKEHSILMLWILLFNHFPNVLFHFFSCKVFVVIGCVNGGMFNSGFFVNLNHLTSVKLHWFILPENWVLWVYSCIFIFISFINYTAETLFPHGKNAGVGFIFSGNIRKMEYSLKCMYISKNCCNFAVFLCSSDFLGK